MMPSVAGSGGEEAGRDESRQIRTVFRAGRIVTTLAEHPYPMGISELARRVQLSPGSVHRLLGTLIGMGWVDQNTRTAKYRLGTRLLGIGAAGLVANPVVELGKTYLAELAEWTGQDALLSTLVGMRNVHLARVAGANSRLAEFQPGRSQPAHAMADGKLLLAFLSPEERAHLYRAEAMHSYTANTIVEPELLEAELDQIRERGYAVDNYERFETGRGLAVPVLGHDKRIMLALLCVGELDPAQDAALVNQMLSMAHQISDQLTMAGDLPGQVRMNARRAQQDDAS
ncbi:IclR family transcriptional regulator [Frankia sp. Hr75.2]|nr:IclR family transcriptional regulator [Frankia sp. Hr75.2]